MELTQLQISEIISNYTSSSEGFVTLQSLINVSSTNLEQSKLCVNSPLYIDTRLLWEQTIGSNSTQ